MILVLTLFLILIFAGVPVAFAAGIAGASYFILHANLPPETIVQVTLTTSQNATLLAVPLFIFAGLLMNASGISTRLVHLAVLLTGHQKGGLAGSSVVLSTLMGGVSGSANADIAMESRILGPSMERQGFPRGYTAAVIGYTSLITATIPPAVGMIMYGGVGDVSIGRLFTAGITSGLLLFVLLLTYVTIAGRIRNFPRARATRATLGEVLKSLKSGVWALAFPVLLIGSLRLGLFTPSEVGAFACLYSLIIGVFVYKELTWKRFVETMRTSVRDVSSIMYLIAMAALFGYGIPFDRIPERLTESLLSLGGGTFVVIAIIIAMLLVFGMFMEGAVIIILLTPILLPVVRAVGVDPVVFGVAMTVVVTLGILTPPFGVGMFIMQTIIKMRIGDFVKESLPFAVVVLLTVAGYFWLDEVVLALPNWIYGPAN